MSLKFGFFELINWCPVCVLLEWWNGQILLPAKTWIRRILLWHMGVSESYVCVFLGIRITRIGILGSIVYIGVTLFQETTISFH